jgi:putative ABC transport system permease protein
MLFGLAPGDPLTYAVAAGGLCVVVLLAALSPARRAARVEPLVALRAE